MTLGADGLHAPVEEEQAVTVFFRLSDDAYGRPEEREEIGELEAGLLDQLAATGVGSFDGDEFGGGWCRIFLYGSDADALATVALDVLHRAREARLSHLVKRFGSPGAPEVRVDLAGGAGPLTQ